MPPPAETTDAPSAETDTSGAYFPREEFLSIIAHELKNPLAPIRSAAEILRLISADALQNHTVSIIDRHVAQLSQRLDELVGRARFHRGAVIMEKLAADLSVMVAKALDTVKPAIDARGQKLTVMVPTQPVPLLCDPSRLTQVLETLLDNASRYADKGGNLSLIAGTDEHELTIEVVDNGRGITPELLPQLFNLFVRHPAPDQGDGPPGIGLAVARNLIELHGGSISAHSEGAGCGSRFTVRLPLDGAPRSEVGG